MVLYASVFLTDLYMGKEEGVKRQWSQENTGKLRDIGLDRSSLNRQGFSLGAQESGERKQMGYFGGWAHWKESSYLWGAQDYVG